MRRFRKVVLPGLVLFVAVALFGAGCTSSDSDITIADFAGVWDAASYLVKSKDDPAMSMDPIALGGSMTATIDTGGRLTGTASIPDPARGMLTFPFAGQLTLIDQGTISIDFQPDIPPLLTDDTARFSLSGSTLVLENDNTTFDWDSDGTPDPSTFRIELRRR